MLCNYKKFVSSGNLVETKINYFKYKIILEHTK
jgi:hypothetical protein